MWTEYDPTRPWTGFLAPGEDGSGPGAGYRSDVRAGSVIQLLLSRWVETEPVLECFVVVLEL